MKLLFSSSVTPAEAGVQLLLFAVWIPAFAGMTEEVTQSFFIDQTGRLRSEAKLTSDL